MKKLIILFFVYISMDGCSPIIRNNNLDLYYPRIYDPYFFYRNQLLFNNRFTPYNPYYYQPRLYIQPTPKVRVITPNKKSNVPIRKFK